MKELYILMKKGTVFIIISIIILTLLNAVYIKEVEKDKVAFRKEAEWQNYRNNFFNGTIDYAFFGDSHTRESINPIYINNSFNFASAGEDYTETYYKIIKLLKKDNITVKNIVLEIDIQTFSDKMRTDENLFREMRYYSQFVDIKSLSVLKKENPLSLFIQSNIPVLGMGEEIMSHFLSPKKLTEIRMGWVNYTTDFSKINKTQSASLLYAKQFSETPVLFENRSFSHFKKILLLAEKENITIILIIYPISYEYDQELIKNNISIDDYYRNLFAEINKTVLKYEVLDYYAVFFHNDTYFGDSDHLNYKGADIFSQKVRGDLETIKYHGN